VIGAAAVVFDLLVFYLSKYFLNSSAAQKSLCIMVPCRSIFKILQPHKNRFALWCIMLVYEVFAFSAESHMIFPFDLFNHKALLPLNYHS